MTTNQSSPIADIFVQSPNNNQSVSHRNPFSSSVSEMITTFSMSTYKVGLKVNPNDQDQRVPVLIWSTCAYTIQSIGIYTPDCSGLINTVTNLSSSTDSVFLCRAPPDG